VAPGTRVLGHCSWQDRRRDAPTLVVVHGMEGSSTSPYMLSTAEKTVAAGFNCIRLNIRNCGGTEAWTTTLYHAGFTEDLHGIIDELVARDRLNEIYIVGFSLGGNIVLKLAGELGRSAPPALRGIVAISPSVDLEACIDTIEQPSNLLYHWRFIRSLKTRMRRKALLFPDRFDVSLLQGVRSIRQFDDRFTAPHCGFKDSADYYRRASALPYLPAIRVPTLIIHAKDDPLIPYAPFARQEMTANPNLFLLAPENGGHVGFVSIPGPSGDRFWAETRAIDFFKALRN
jgi:predicted alpha/beta-fold hydrolase